MHAVVDAAEGRTVTLTLRRRGPVELALDLDGTLLTLAARHQAVLRHAARSLGLEVDAAAWWLRRTEGHGSRAALHAQGLGEAAVDALMRLVDHESERWPWLGFDAPQPGAQTLLSAAAAQGWRLHLLVTRRVPDGARQQLDRLGWLPRWASLTMLPAGQGTLESARAKAQVLRRHGCQAYLGDAEVDALAADLAGVPCALVGRGCRSSLWLRRHMRQSVYADLLLALQSPEILHVLEHLRPIKYAGACKDAQERVCP